MGVRLAPFNDSEVDNLRRRQSADWLHGYTCGASSRHGELIPVRAGWVCPRCDYVQDWAHAADVEGRFPPRLPIKQPEEDSK